MALFAGGPVHPDVLELCTRIHTQRFSLWARRSNKLWRCYAKVAVNDDEDQKPQSSGKTFSIKIPTIPRIGDMEAARRLLEAAFQALPFGIPKIPISKLPIPKNVLIFDITGFVATRLGRPQKGLQNKASDEGQYPRCSWPRVSTSALPDHSSLGTMLTSYDSQEYGNGSSLVLEQRPRMYPHSKWPRTAVRSKKSGCGNEAEKIGMDTSVAGSSSLASFEAAMAGGGLQSNQESNCELGWSNEDFPLVIDQGGPRCAWPRKTIPAKLSRYVETPVGTPQKLQIDVAGAEKCGGSSFVSEEHEASALPRRILATSVGLTVMNQLARRGFFMASSFVDCCSSLPAGPLELGEDEGDGALDLGRRTLLLFIKNSTG